MNIKVRDIESLIFKYGADTKLSDVLEKLKTNWPYECPQCHGEGKVTIRVPHPNEHGGGDWGYITKEKTCELCNGVGRTEVKYAPKMEQVGWQIIENS